MIEPAKTTYNRLRRWKIPTLLKNKYVCALLIFFVWMLCFDQNNFFVQLERYRALRQTETKKKYYKEEIAKTQQQLDELFTNQHTLEKFAREKYYMKKPDEDVFVIIEK
jgi:cell division protein FtsB